MGGFRLNPHKIKQGSLILLQILHRMHIVAVEEAVNNRENQ